MQLGEAPAPPSFLCHPRAFEGKRKKKNHIKVCGKICTRCGVEKKSCNRWLNEGQKKHSCAQAAGGCVWDAQTHTDRHTHALCFSWFVYLPPNSTSLRPLWSEHRTCPALPKWDRQPCDPLNNLSVRMHTHTHAHILMPVCRCSCRPI